MKPKYSTTIYNIIFIIAIIIFKQQLSESKQRKRQFIKNNITSKAKVMNIPNIFIAAILIEVRESNKKALYIRIGCIIIIAINSKYKKYIFLSSDRPF